jgi:hypothetical protein
MVNAIVSEQRSVVEFRAHLKQIVGARSFALTAATSRARDPGLGPDEPWLPARVGCWPCLPAVYITIYNPDLDPHERSASRIVEFIVDGVRERHRSW